jgi:hypothetical protein
MYEGPPHGGKSPAAELAGEVEADPVRHVAVIELVLEGTRPRCMNIGGPRGVRGPPLAGR